MFIPYKVKNPIKRFPIATVCLIAANIFVYLMTTEYFLFIREEVVLNYAFLLGGSPLHTFFSSIFLHGDIFHLLGNMLFLWVFGPPVEDRLRIPGYLFAYFLTGFIGSLLQAGLDSMVVGEVRPVIGASGCIMGIVGAYWYLFSWSTVCVFYWFYWFWRGTWEIAAIWVIGLYLLMDVGEGILYGATGVSGGVANFAHVGGAVAGALICIGMKIKRDTEAISEAKAIQSDMRDVSNMPLHALETMLEEDPGNPELIRAMIMPALRLGKQSSLDTAFASAGASLVDKDPNLVVHYLADLHGNATIYKPMHILRLAGQQERSGKADMAMRLYKMLCDIWPADPSNETALYRMALCSWNSMGNADSARNYLRELHRRYPNGEMMSFARVLWNKMQT